MLLANKVAFVTGTYISAAGGAAMAKVRTSLSPTATARPLKPLQKAFPKKVLWLTP